jgi:hypothetical protein
MPALNEFEDSRLFWLHPFLPYRGEVKSIDGLATGLYGHLFPRSVTKKRQKHLWLLIRDLAVNWLQSPTQYISVHKNKNKYASKTYFHAHGIKYDPMIAVLNQLRSHGFITTQNGYYNRDGYGNSRITRIRATQLLIDKFLAFKVKEDIDAVYPVINPYPPVEIRSSHKVPIRFLPTPMIEEMAQFVTRYNKALEASHIDVSLLGYSKPVKIDLTRKFVRRVFNNSTIENGGRLAGAWWLNCPKAIRQRILLNRLETHEIDLTALHPILLYAIKHIDYFQQKGKDPYQCVDVKAILNRDLTEIEIKQFRSFFKAMFMMLINNNEEHIAKQALRDLIKMENSEAHAFGETLPLPDRLDPKKFNALWEIFKEAHSDINEFFAGNHHNEIATALTLMKIDSNMMMDILEMMLNNNVTCLSVHDSLIVPWIHVDLAHEVIKDSFINTLKKLGLAVVSAEMKIRPFFNEGFTKYAKESFVNDIDLKKRSLLRRPSFINYIPVVTQPT